MEQDGKWSERRRHPRYSPDRKNYPKVNFAANGAAKVPIDVVNISQGGMLGFTIKNDFMTENNHTRIKEIEIVFPGKLPFYCSGNLLRVHPTSGAHKCLCAIQFDEIGFDRNKKQLRIGERIENSLRPIEDVIIPDEIFINRLEKFDNYMKINDPKLGSEIRKRVYDSFDDITSNLSLEEKWYFFEMADELKLREPEYPAALKESFINLCRVGLEQSLKKANTVKKEIN